MAAYNLYHNVCTLNNHTITTTIVNGDIRIYYSKYERHCCDLVS